MRAGLALFTLALVVLVAVPAQAQSTNTSRDLQLDAPEPSLLPSLGIRTGGYGFRHEVDGSTEWQDCRMDGFGVFGQLAFAEHFFSELAVDYYFATGQTVASGMDRQSVHTQASIGVRMFDDFWFTPHFRLGTGVEWTQVDIHEAQTRSVYPVAFAGLGGEVHYQALSFGIELRLNAMAHPEHSHGTNGQVEAAKHDELETASADELSSTADEVPMSMNVSGHALFTIRYDL